MHMNLQSSSFSLEAFFFITCVAKNLHPWQQTQWRSYLHGRPAHSSLEVWPDLPVYKSGRQSEGRDHINRSVISKFKYKHRKIVIDVLHLFSPLSFSLSMREFQSGEISMSQIISHLTQLWAGKFKTEQNCLQVIKITQAKNKPYTVLWKVQSKVTRGILIP